MNFKIETPKYTEVQKLVSKGYDLLLNEYPFFSLQKRISQNFVVKIDIFPYKNNSCLMMRLTENKHLYRDINEFGNIINSYRDCMYDILTSFRIIERLD